MKGEFSKIVVTLYNLKYPDSKSERQSNRTKVLILLKMKHSWIGF